MRRTSRTPLRPSHALCALGLSLLAVGCAPKIGDDCRTALDCSAQGSRICDRTLPGGYCTIEGCEQGTCPDEAVCVQFRPQEPRLASTYCMLRCSGNDDCRTDRGYACLRAEDFGAGQEAIVLDGARKRFCGLVLTPGDEGMTNLDAGGIVMGMPRSAIGELTDAMVGDASTMDGSVRDAAVEDAAMGDAAMGDAGGDAAMDGAVEDAAMGDADAGL